MNKVLGFTLANIQALFSERFNCMKIKSSVFRNVVPLSASALLLLIVGCDISSSSTSDILSAADEADLQEALTELNATPDTSGSTETPAADTASSSTSSSTTSTPAAQAPTTAVAAVPVNGSESFFRGVRFRRSDPAAPNARVTKSLSNVSTSSRGVTFTMSDISDWPQTGPARGLYGVMMLAVFRNGAWEGGKFDHVRSNTTFRNFNNVGGYLPVQPVSGEPVRFWLTNYSGTEASNFVETTWP